MFVSFVVHLRTRMTMDASLKSCSCSSNSSCGSSSSSLSPTPPFCRPKSPPAASGLDLYGKRRQLVKIQILEREIGLLQEELKSVDELQPASRCCKEVDDFVGAKVDPFMALNDKSHKSNPCWKNLCYPWRWSWCSRCFKMPKWCSCSQLCKKMPCKNCCKSTCGVSCSVCCFNSSICKCKNLNFCCN
ncbi:guanine nucleotide-binding protein subunit gamma 3-like isoform X2 [Euphorbia lathyris]|uniref:guanine nucleotide-binding protein subunit gamma 3-like isoform X2 n=1 Tax=Euphorbia lathyris TaxID=212925 RepID=UPI003313CB3D